MNKNQSKEKIKAILLWYKLSSQEMDNKTKLKVLKLWKEICVEFEEYEIASKLRKERNSLLRKIKKSNRKRRTLISTLKIFYRLIRIKSKKLF